MRNEKTSLVISTHTKKKTQVVDINQTFIIATDKRVSGKYFSYFFTKTHVLGTYQKCLSKARDF